MPRRRILAIWFPRLAAERLLRAGHGVADAPFAVVERHGNMEALASLCPAASAAGLAPGQPLRDAHSACPGLVTRPADPGADARFLGALRLWAGKFSPWVGEAPPAGLVADLTGCAHLFGGEEALLGTLAEDCARLRLTARPGIADTLGAAWALARHAGQPARAVQAGDAVDQEARATRVRAAKRRHWTKGGPAPIMLPETLRVRRIAPPGGVRGALAPLPAAALRLAPDTVETLSRLGLRRVGDLAGMPRATLARRFGQALLARLDQAMGAAPEPVCPAEPPPRFAVRLSLPEPIGLEKDVLAAIDRLLPELERRLRGAGRAARRVRVQLFRVDSGTLEAEVVLARPSASPDRIRPLLLLGMGDVDAGFGIDAVRLEAPETEPARAEQCRGGIGDPGEDGPIRDLVGRIGTRLGTGAVTRAHPVDSHAPEKTGRRLAAARSEPAASWPGPPASRPLLVWRPEAVEAPGGPEVPGEFRWRGRAHGTAAALGPERISPEWWLDEPEWRTGVRDYWEVVTGRGERLWLYRACGGAGAPGWFCHGAFA